MASKEQEWDTPSGLAHTELSRAKPSRESSTQQSKAIKINLLTRLFWPNLLLYLYLLDA